MFLFGDVVVAADLGEGGGGLGGTTSVLVPGRWVFHGRLLIHVVEREKKWWFDLVCFFSFRSYICHVSIIRINMGGNWRILNRREAGPFRCSLNHHHGWDLQTNHLHCLLLKGLSLLIFSLFIFHSFFLRSINIGRKLPHACNFTYFFFYFLCWVW